MELSPEDRDRIFQEEKARRDAQERLKREEKQKNARYGCLGCLGFLILGAIIVAITPKASQQSTDDVEAYVQAKTFIRQQLKAPATAEFPSRLWNDGEVHVVSIQNGAYRVSAWVEAQNAFGAKLRTNWSCELKKESPDSDSWRVSGFCGLHE
jgi:hypothetical protein